MSERWNTGTRSSETWQTWLFPGRWLTSRSGCARCEKAWPSPDGRRTFRLLPGEPLPTSYGQDLYQSVFGTADQAARV